MNDNSQLFEPDNSYSDCLVNWNIIDIVKGSNSKAREMGSEYLLSNEREHPLDFEYRLQRSIIPPVYASEANRGVSKIFNTKKQTLGVESLHPEIAKFVNNIDNQGNSLLTIAKSLCHDIINYGCAGGIVDYLSVDQARLAFSENGLPWSRSISDSINARPFFTQLPPRSVIYSKDIQVFGLKYLSEVRVIYDDINSSDRYLQRIYMSKNGVYIDIISDETEEDTKTFELRDVNGNNITSIPICVGYSSYQNKIGFYRATPTMLALAENILHQYNIESNLDSSIHTFGVPILSYGSDNESTDEELRIGSKEIFKHGTDEFLRYVEPNGAALAAGEKQLERVKQEREHLGFSSLLRSNTGSMTATERALNQVEASSKLTNIAAAVKGIIQDIVNKYGMWLGIPIDDVGLIEFNTDFSSVTMNESQQIEYVKVLQADFLNGALSLETYLNEKKRLGFLEPSFDPELEIQRIQESL